MVKVPLSVGVPEIVFPEMVRPEGRLEDARVYEIGLVPVALSV